MLLIKLWSLFLSVVIAVPTPMINYRKVAARDMKYSVLLHMRGKRMEEGRPRTVRYGCSGTYISPTEILTAAHCFQGYKVEKIWARGPVDTLGYPVVLRRLSVGRDLAVLEAPYPHTYAKLGGSPRVGDEVLSIGSPLSFEFVASQGIVSVLALRVQPYTGTYTISTAMIDHGSSGGGMFDRKGRLIGVNTMSVGLFGWGGLSFAVDRTTIEEFLRG